MPLSTPCLTNMAGTNLRWRRLPFQEGQAPSRGCALGSPPPRACATVGIALDRARHPGHLGRPRGCPTRPRNVVSAWWTPVAWKSTPGILTPTAAASRPPAPWWSTKKNTCEGPAQFIGDGAVKCAEVLAGRPNVRRGVALGARRGPACRSGFRAGRLRRFGQLRTQLHQGTKPGPQRTPRAEVHLGRSGWPWPHLGVVHLMRRTTTVHPVRPGQPPDRPEFAGVQHAGLSGEAIALAGG